MVIIAVVTLGVCVLYATALTPGQENLMSAVFGGLFGLAVGKKT